MSFCGNIRTSISPDEIRTRAFLRCVDGCRIGYTERTNNLELLNQRVHQIVEDVKTTDNARARVSARYEKAMESLKSSRCYVISTSDSDSYTFINKDQYFDGNNLNEIAIESALSNLIRKANESNAAAALFGAIQSNADFKNNPSNYIKKWRSEISKAIIAEWKVLKRLNSINKDGQYCTVKR